MRKALFGFLMAATMATPVAAQEASEMPERYQRKAESNQARSDRQQQRSEHRAQRAERQTQHAQPMHVERHQDTSQNDGLTERYRRLGERNQQRYGGAEQGHRHDGATTQHAGSDRGNHREIHRDYQREHRELHRSNPSRREHREFHREVERDHRQVHRETHRDLHRDVRAEHEALHRSNPTRREHRQFHREVNREHNRYHNQWDRGWRQDNRYDWQNYRSYNRGIFSPGIYYSPFRNHRYSRFGLGNRLHPGFYGSSYWITDPWRYRLPQPYAGTRWVRYYDDVLLVDLYTGEVVDVIYNFFW